METPLSKCIKQVR